MAMTSAAVPAVRAEAAVADVWVPRIAAGRYDPAARPAAEKAGVTIGMAMTEKQGGSDVRANTTRAEPAGEDGWYSLTGHKWFCSAPKIGRAHVELQSLMRNSYALFCLKKKKHHITV